MKKYIGVLLLLVLVLPACSKDLTRGQAKKILSKKPMPNVIYVPLVQEYSIHDGRDEGPYDYVSKLTQGGYGSFKREVKYIYLLTTPVADHAVYTFTPNEKLKPFIVDEVHKKGTTLVRVKIGEFTIEDVVGISKESETTCEVQYKLRQTTNELVKLLDLHLPETQVLDRPQKAYFKLYDDGWRRDEERGKEMIEKGKEELRKKGIQVDE